MTNISKYNYTSQRQDYMTPPEFVLQVMKDYLISVFECDTCCTEFNIPAHVYYKEDGLYHDGVKTSSENGLTGRWFKTNWCNPPFRYADKFVKKAIAEQKKGNTTYMLIPVRTETEYWYNGIYEKGRPRKDIEVTFLKKGLCFIDPATHKPVQMQKTLKDGSKIFVDGVYKDALALVIFKPISSQKFCHSELDSESKNFCIPQSIKNSTILRRGGC